VADFEHEEAVMKPGVAVFHDDDRRYYADTCEPLRRGVEREEVQLFARVRGAYPGTPLPDDALPEVRSVGFWDAPFAQTWGLDWHRNEGVELMYVARGRVGYAVDGEEYSLKSGDLVVTRPWQLHRVGSPLVGACRVYWLILDVGVRRPNQAWRWPNWMVWSNQECESLTANLSHNERPVWQADEEVGQYFERLGEAVRDFSEEAGDSRCKLYINGLLISLSEMLRRNQPPLDPSLSSSLRAVELFLADLPAYAAQEWTVDSMAAACGLGRSRFIHFCKQITNLSPNDYLTRCRIEAATAMLAKSPGTSITDIAHRAGFGSSQYFATVFRRHHGCTPSDFREHLIRV
jgi:AraC family L-rhamnose operon regulatory protein RhaS